MRGYRLVLPGVAVVATIVLLVGCGSQRSPQVPGAAATDIGTTTAARPEQVPGVPLPDGGVGQVLDELEGHAEQLIESSGVPGMAVAVVHEGKVVYQKGFGVRDVDGRQPVGTETVFPLASMSKPIAATVVAQQVTQGGVGWDTPVRALAPWFALQDSYVGDHVTVGDLFAGRAGLPAGAGGRLEDLGYDRGQILERLRLLPLAPFRDSYASTDFGLTAAAVAVAEAAGLDWATLAEQAIYHPLGMTATSSRHGDFEAVKDRTAGHVVVDGEYRRAEPGRRPDAQSPAGGVSSSAKDMARWMMMVLGAGMRHQQQVVAPEALLPALSPQSVPVPLETPDARSGFYGFGFQRDISAAGRVVLSHSGAFDQGASTAFTLIPSADVGIVTLTNAAPVGVPETLNAEFADLVQFGEVRRDWRGLYRRAAERANAPVGELVGALPPAQPVPPARLSSYEGLYRNKYYGPATVVAGEHGLMLTLGPAEVTVPLRHWDGDTFVFAPVGESAAAGTVSQARFDGEVLVLEFYDGSGSGTFTRS